MVKIEKKKFNFRHHNIDSCRSDINRSPSILAIFHRGRSPEVFGINNTDPTNHSVTEPASGQITIYGYVYDNITG